MNKRGNYGLETWRNGFSREACVRSFIWRVASKKSRKVKREKRRRRFLWRRDQGFTMVGWW